MGEQDDTIRELRLVAADAHHGLRQQRARGDAVALSAVLAEARAAGASPEQLARITDRFETIAEQLVRDPRPRGARRLRLGWRRREDKRPGELAPPPSRPELGPGPAGSEPAGR
ncbi:MAG TPA: hypothetical protein VK501_10190 [Baekduia sp.]|uniref:hypothetical protein n=1 Tax=Baekduia sp. TaxID=2600305 RepID=UPI002C3448A7|nr:hypothetical protein [Baekduia sp.]HMJ34278.1 hypothetical protein [Baekduia sp.]